MDNNENSNIDFYSKLVRKNGSRVQINKCTEELVELLDVLIKSQTKPGELSIEKLKEKVVTEMSHVLMTFESLKIVFNISEEDIEKEIELKKKLLNWNEGDKIAKDKNVVSKNENIAKDKKFDGQDDFA
jgi:hypothetical protein